MVSIAERGEVNATKFSAIRISIASPEQIRGWSHGLITKPETINYRTLRPEKDGLFCERIFGPTKDWECFCGKYKRIRYRGVICDRCGVEVTRSRVRRERMAHIELAASVAHIWFSKGTPSRLGLLLDLSPRNLERVLYFAQHVIISVDDEARDYAMKDEKDKLDAALQNLRSAAAESISQLIGVTPEEVVLKEGEPTPVEGLSDEISSQVIEIEEKLDGECTQQEIEYESKIDELEDLRRLKLVTETRYRDLRSRYPDVFRASMGAEGVLEILRDMNLENMREQLMEEMQSTSGQRRKKAIKRLKVVEAFRKSGNKPEWMVLKVLPVLPPELRPMVQLDGGRFATSDLNDLYRRVINRNNRLRRLIDLGAPEIIIRNEKRMLQEAVDALIDNGRRGRPIQGSHNHKLKSLSDLLRGKQGRFRQNLLGKRVDYSGRSVIVAGPDLELHQCGLPKRMALELFKPFVMHRLVLLGVTPNIKSAKRMVERGRGEVWDVLEDVIKDRPVMLNRAPTLHRLGIQAFMPILIEGSAIQIHPLVCPAFNADFDGDQMAVHVPLSRMAVIEAKETMISTHNMLSPASGEPLVAPTLDMVLGCYYLTEIKSNVEGTGKQFLSFEEARLAYDSDYIDLQAEIKIWSPESSDGWLRTSVGRIIMNEVLPPELEYKNQIMDKGTLKDLTSECYRLLGNEKTAKVLDKIKTLGFHHATKSGITIAMNDIQVSPKKFKIIEHANKEVEEYESDYMLGLMTEDERYTHTVNTWTQASDAMEEIVKEEMGSYGGIAVMAVSGAKGNIAQIKQMAGMRGLMSNPKGKIIDLPIKSSFREGLTALEYFISTHGARKGLADTALRTADSGYLTRRLTDVCQDVIILEKDCGMTEGTWLHTEGDDPLVATMAERALGRMAATPVIHPGTGEVIVGQNEEITEGVLIAIESAGITEVQVRSPLSCQAQRGLCQLCYGRSPATSKQVQMGEAVGIIAAQSIGEPGTQLTMRTFHTGGVAGVDITSGLPRVEELFEARIPKGAAILSDIDGLGEIEEDSDGRRVRIVSKEEYQEDYQLPKGSDLLVSDGQEVEAGTQLATIPEPKKTRGRKKKEVAEAADGQDLPLTKEIVAGVGGRVKLNKNSISILWADVDDREHFVPASALLLVKDGDAIKAGDALTAGPLNPHDILRVKGKNEVQRYLAEQVQRVYRSQGVQIHDRHIEVVIRQMSRRVQVDTAGDSEYIPGQSVDLFNFQNKNMEVLAEGGEPATAKPVLLGITRSSLLTDSFLAAASFQETTRVLTEAAASGAEDHLLGLKENVIIGRLIPARVHLDLPPRVDAFTIGEEKLLADFENDSLMSAIIDELSGPVSTSLAPSNNDLSDINDAPITGILDSKLDDDEDEMASNGVAELGLAEELGDVIQEEPSDDD
ncbi:DNA-directed RNA polymerase subunit beta' [SAR202 cluster bacterium AD-804-J14_MRT_500m]|nr:DNA-directed RNA polymerase subunit beta' [SAR202 cluster bacterium AD-804-J14_MRT_500m]